MPERINKILFLGTWYNSSAANTWFYGLSPRSTPLPSAIPIPSALSTSNGSYSSARSSYQPSTANEKV